MVEIKQDCFGYMSSGKCSVIQDKYGMNCKDCKFYKTKEEYKQKVAPLRHKKSKKYRR